MREPAGAWFRLGALIAMSSFAIACAGAAGTGEHSESAGEHERGEGGHAESTEAAGHEGEGEGEESGVYIGADETWDAVRRGARLILAFDAESNAFIGTVENISDAPLCGVRVEVHLLDGPELGPTVRTDLRKGEPADLRLPTEGHAFTSWTAHPEMDVCPSTS